MTIEVPATFCVGLARNSSSDFSSHVAPAAFSACVYAKSASEPALRPTTPRSDGPTPFCPVFTEWQAVHWV